ncbi:hypothetical protein [Anaeromyxobacter terrae]|uniref:hypothetical protein n=1 Tax=Anaeromyxobacter terrae TaxID=2925406 RepID=UPI001F57F840|nr:hypothetical protein [Anaeromyxobacter sp. SG22]
MELRVALTNDGRVWLPFGATGIDDLGFFDPARGTFTNTGLHFYEGPWLAASGNGERLMVDGRTGRMHLERTRPRCSSPAATRSWSSPCPRR